MDERQRLISCVFSLDFYQCFLTTRITFSSKKKEPEGSMDLLFYIPGNFGSLVLIKKDINLISCLYRMLAVLSL